MKRSEKNTALFIFTFTGLSGLSIWALKKWGTSPGAFGPIQHPLLDEVHLIHNIFNILFLFMFGWLGSTHIRNKLKAGLKDRRRSGLLLISLFLVISLSGQTLLYFSDRNLLDIGRQIHLLIGLSGLALFYFHSRSKKALVTAS